MIIEFYHTAITAPKIDKVNGVLRDVVVMTTEFNLNENANFSRTNQQELVDLGNTRQILSYLGHAKKGITSDDRLPFRIGSFSNFRVDDTRVVADLKLSKTLDTNPILPAGLRDYVYSLAENESNQCGFSMVVGLQYNDNDTVTIGDLMSIDLVGVPALTQSMFAKSESTDMINRAHETLTPVIGLLVSLDESIKAGQNITPTLQTLIGVLSGLYPVAAITEEAVETAAQEAQEEAQEPTPDATSLDASPSLLDLQSDIACIKDQVAQLMASLLAMQSFAKEEPKVEPETKEEPKKVVFSVMEPVAHETIVEAAYSVDTYNEYKQNGQYKEASIYFKQWHK